MKHSIQITLLLIAVSLNAIALEHKQSDSTKQNSNFWDKVYFGGNIGMQFGSSTLIEVSPLVGYRITPKFSAGVGITYQYFHYRYNRYNIETNVYGGRVFGRYFFMPFLFGHVEYEYLNLEAFDFYPQRRRVDVGSLLGGGGYAQQLGPRSAIIAMILYNFTESVYTPYTNPIVRIGVTFGL